MRHRICSSCLVAALLAAGGATAPGLARAQTEEGAIDLAPILDAMQRGGDVSTQEDESSPDEEAGSEGGPAADEGTSSDSAARTGGAALTTASLPAYSRAASGPAAAPEATTVLLPFVTRPFDRMPRISGENGGLRLYVNVDSPDAVTEMRLSLRSSVNLLPEQSSLAIFLNGEEVDRFEPSAFEGFETRVFPADNLVAGENVLDVRAMHTHRIFCGPEASFQVWTELDLGQSGLSMPRSALPTGAEGFVDAMTAQIMGGQGVTVESGSNVPPELLVRLGQRLRGLAPGASALLSTSSPYAPAAERPELARISYIDATRPNVELRRGGDGALVLVIAGTPTSEMLDAFLPAPAPASDVPALSPDEPLALAEMGVDLITMESRYARQDVVFTLPDDWLLSASQRSTIDLDYHYIDGLPEGSLLLVKVNDTTVRMLPLFGEGGADLPTLDVGLPTRILTAGPNALTFEAIIPGDPPDLPCVRIPGPFVEVEGSTTITVPPSPSMTFLTISEALRELTPGDITTPVTTDPRSLTGRTVAAIRESFQPLPEAAGARLTITGLADMERSSLASTGVSRLVIENLLAPVGTPAGGPPPPRTTMDEIRARLTSVGAQVVHFGRPGDPPLEGWLEGRHGQAFIFLDDPENPLSAQLVLAPGTEPEIIAAALSDARFDPFGPKGAAAVLTEDGIWQSWRPASEPPRLREPLSLANFRAVAGNYASWSPALFAAILAALVIVSVLLALSFIVRSRGTQKR